MTLRQLTTVCSGFITAAFIFAVFVISHSALVRNYQDLEQAHVGEDLNRTIGIVQSEINNLNRTAHDYGTWDSTFAYVKAPNKTYIESELSPTNLTMYGVGTYMLIDRRGRTVLNQSYGLTPPHISPTDQQELNTLAKKYASAPGDQGAAGMFELSDGGAIVVVCPVLRSSGRGAPAGALVMIRKIDSLTLLHWSNLAQLPFTISGNRRQSTARPEPTSSFVFSRTIQPKNEQVMLASAKIIDIWGQPNFTLSFSHERGIWRQGQTAFRVTFLALGILGLIFGMVTFCVVDLRIVKRIRKLMRLTQDVRGDAGLNLRVELSGNDEITELGRQMNSMLEKLEASQQELLMTQKQLEFQATHDYLTGVCNRAMALATLDRELLRDKREHTTTAVILLDVDHFKQINDRHGHAVGDCVLRLIATDMKEALRNCDLVARYGGEEFLVMLTNCNLEDAATVAQRIIRRVEHLPIPVDSELLRITVSAGVSATPNVTSGELIAQADRALYRSKALGRNRVEIESGTVVGALSESHP
jgi:diguanylate cyclase (GGDEF)-like protein